MAEVNEGTGAPETGAEGKEAEDKSRSQESVLAEMNRKYAKLNESNQSLSEKIEQLVTMVAKQTTPQNSASASRIEADEKELVDLAYTNPAEYARRIVNTARKEAAHVVNNAFGQQQETSNVLSKLGGEYPELADNASELTLKSVSIYKNMTESERSSPMAYKVAVRDAAAELGILPKTKRPKDGGYEPNVGNSNSGANEQGKAQLRAKEKGAVKANDRTLEIAALMGLDTSKKEVRENLDKRAQEIANKRSK